MNQLFLSEMEGIKKVPLDLLKKDALLQKEEAEKIGFDIGRDWAYYHQPLPSEADAAIYRGFKSNTSHPSGKYEIDRFTKKWLQVRYHAYLRKRPVSDDVDVQLIKALDRDFCPITKEKLTHGTLGDNDWSLERLCNTAGYALGNLIIESKKANEARGSISYDAIVQASNSKRHINGLSPECWKRYAIIARGPNFWAGNVKGIEPLVMPLPELVFCVPSLYLMDVAFFSCCHSSEKNRIAGHRLMKNFSKSSISQLNLKKLRAKIDRKFQNRFGRFDIFQNKSCFNAFLAWYESSTITEKDFKRIMLIEKNNSLGIKSPINASSNMLEEWWLGTNGHLY